MEVVSESLFDPLRLAPIVGTVVNVEKGRVYFQVGAEIRPRSLIAARVRRIGPSKVSQEAIKEIWDQATERRKKVLQEKEKLLAAKQQPV